ncbi:MULTISPECIES: DUF2630 family protein [Streptomyces]|uniref:DUF2630 family protein n=1 Tax=Streptomyces TaxID=1883 RepID=UPI001369AE27|nr:DUF2630 family protein [Streptomyces sp. SID2888]MYV44252.1 DUF2630 family protein [Streptomyces sp. SID2888]MYV50629.1 DUF2630 family protein [Streptomyces sp. SID2888]
MAEEQIMARIAAMVDEERGLRDALSSGRIDSATEQERLADLERALDQCWDLLRQRRAKAEFGENPNEARVRPAAQVEDYKG